MSNAMKEFVDELRAREDALREDAKKNILGAGDPTESIPERRIPRSWGVAFCIYTIGVMSGYAWAYTIFN